MFIRRCAWHPKYHGYSKILGITWHGWGIEFSHGICADCAARTRAEWRLPQATEAASAAPTPVPAPHRPLRSLRPDFALAAAVVLLAVTATFALVGVPGVSTRPEQRSAAVDRRAIDQPSESTAGSSSAPAPAASAATGHDAGKPASTLPRAPATSPSGPAVAATPGASPQLAEAPANRVGPAPVGGRSSRGRVARVRGRSVGGAAIVPVTAPEICPCPSDGTRVAAAPTHVPAAAADAGPPVAMRHFGANRFNEVQAP